MEKLEKLDKLLRNGVSRRTFLAGAGVSAGTAAVATLAAGCGSSKVTATPGPTTAPVGSFTDADILNFALNLEYLEAEFYSRAVFGTGLSSADIGGSPGAVTGGAQVSFITPTLLAYATEIANDEIAHVRFLRSALGSAAVSRPAIDFTNGFAALGTAAKLAIGAGFNPFLGEAIFLVGAFTFEDVGVTAYHGAAGLITNKTYLGAAAGIMATEAYHAALLRSSLSYLGNPYLTYADQISAARGAVSMSASATAITAEVPPSGPMGGPPITIVPADANSIAFDRTTDEVLRIVYLTAQTTPAAPVGKGGFFPNGLNGTITLTTT
ncbi:MAG TPA: ferritin-like domain-containing protein [Acidisarcina sp.]